MMRDFDSKDILKSIDKVFNYNEVAFMDDNSLEPIMDSLTIISSYFGISYKESYVFTILFILCIKEKRVTYSTLIDHFRQHPTNFFHFLKELDSLCEKDIFMKSDSLENVEFYNISYSLNQRVVIDLTNDKPFGYTKPVSQDIFSLLERIGKMVDYASDYVYDDILLSSQLSELLETNRDITFINKLLQLNLLPENRLILLYVVWTAVDKNSDTDAGTLFYSIYKSASKRVRAMQGIYDGSNELIRIGLIEIGESLFITDTQIRATDNLVNLAKSCGISFNSRAVRLNNIIHPSVIKSKRLIFNENEVKQLQTIKELLRSNNYEEFVKSADRNNNPQGVTVLLYGNPGTGKTESVLQLARESDREILKVDLSHSKSMWFGESEKQIKKIFTDYRKFHCQSERTPILFINEVDGLISKRVDISYHISRQTENTMQSILLEEIENFNGILIATTNNTGNFDRAFDRRFLFKIHFPDPDYEVRAKIWRDKRPDLSEAECYRLSSEFKISGAQIDNIVRRLSIEEVLHGNMIPIDKIMEFCSDENYKKDYEKGRIGFL